MAARPDLAVHLGGIDHLHGLAHGLGLDEMEDGRERVLVVAAHAAFPGNQKRRVDVLPILAALRRQIADVLPIDDSLGAAQAAIRHDMAVLVELLGQDIGATAAVAVTGEQGLEAEILQSRLVVAEDLEGRAPLADRIDIAGDLALDVELLGQLPLKLVVLLDRPRRNDKGIERQDLAADQARAREAGHARIVAGAGHVRGPGRATRISRPATTRPKSRAGSHGTFSPDSLGETDSHIPPRRPSGQGSERRTLPAATGQPANSRPCQRRPLGRPSTPPPRRRSRSAGSHRPDGGRPRRCRPGRRAASTCPRGRTRAGRRPVLAVGPVPVADQQVGGVRGVLQRVVGRGPPGPPRSPGSRPGSPIIASQNRSSSALASLSVGSTIIVPATGQDMVGAWKP